MNLDDMQVDITRRRAEKKRYRALSRLPIPAGLYHGYQEGRGHGLEPELKRMLSEGSAQTYGSLCGYIGMMSGSCAGLILSRGKRPVENAAMGALAGATGLGGLAALVTEGATLAGYTAGYFLGEALSEGSLGKSKTSARETVFSMKARR